MRLVPFAISTLFSLAAASSSAQTVPVTPPPTYSYEAHTVRQLEVRGHFGRYITFIGKTVNNYEGTSGHYRPGSPGYTSCVGGVCRRIGYIAPRYTPGTPGGTQERSFTYELDCVDMTFDRKGDKAGGIYNRGWMPVATDPTAAEVARIYCPQISSLLGKPTGSTSSTSASSQTSKASEEGDIDKDWVFIGTIGEGAEEQDVYTSRIGFEKGQPVGETLYVNANEEEDKSSAAVWDCSGHRYRWVDSSKWNFVEKDSIGWAELEALCAQK